MSDGSHGEGSLAVRDGRVVYASEGLVALAGRPAAEIVGRDELELLVPEDRARVADVRARRRRGEPSPALLEVSLQLPGGGRRAVEWHVDRDSSAAEVVHVRDLCADAARRELLDGIAEVGANLRAERSEEGVHARLRRDLGRLGIVSALLRAEGERTRLLWVTAPDALRREFTERAGAPPEGFAGPMSEFARRIVADGAAFTDDWAAYAGAWVPASLAADARTVVQGAGFGRSIGVRIEAPGDAGVYLVVAAPALRGEDVAAVRLFGAQVSAALDAARTIADLSRRNAHLGALARVAELAGNVSDLPSFFASASEVVRPVAGYVACAVYVADEAAGTLLRAHVDAGVPPALEQLGRTIPLASPLGEVVRDRAARVMPVPYPGGRQEIREALPYRSVAWVPLVARSRSVGVLTAGFSGPPELARAAIELLSSVAAHFASAIESHGLLADLRRRVDELTLVVDVARASAELDPELLLDGGLHRVATTFAADGAAAWLREDDRLVLAATEGLGRECAASLAELDAAEGAPGLAMERRDAVRTSAAEALGARGPLPGCPAHGPAIAVPLVANADPVGAILLVRAAGAPFTDGEAAVLASLGAQLGVAVDASRLLADVRRRLADLEAVQALTLRVFANAPGDTGALFQDACRELVRTLSATAAAVFLGDGGGGLRLAASVGIPASAGDVAIDLARDGIAAEVIGTRSPLQSEDLTRDPRSQLFGRTGVPPLAALVVPLVSRRDVRGVVYVADRAGRRFGAGEIAVASALAGALGVGFENAELYAEARRRVEELSVLNEAARRIGGSLDLDEVLREAAEAARRLAGTPRAYVILHDPVKGEISFGAGAGLDPAALRGLRGPVPPGTVIARVLREGRAEAVEDTQRSDVGEVYRGAFGGRALAAAPVLLRGEPLGVLVAEEPAAPRRFSASDLERLTGVADRLAAALENARLYLETRDRAEQLGLLHEVGRSLIETLDIEQVLDRGIRNLARIVGAPDAFLFLASEDGASLTFRSMTRHHDKLRGVALPARPPENNLAARVLASREPLVLEDGERYPLIRRDLVALTGGRAYLALPLIVRERAIGAVVIVETRGPRLFTPAEVERAAAVANQLAVAAENARLYEDLRRSYAQLARAQQQLVQGERLAALGELSAVVAHEVRNPLGVIFNSLGSLRRLVRPTGDAKMLFDIVEEESERLNRIVGDLLDFARPSTPDLRPEPLARVAEDAVAAAVPPQGGGIEVVRELDPSLPPVPVDARLVRQAVLNLAVNAVQAMPRGGRLTLRARRDGDAAVVEVEDTGPGIPDEVRARIFEPFFTTKASGTGLGLAVVRRIVEGHGGEIRVRSAPGAGTAFALRFPLQPGPVENGPAMR